MESRECTLLFAELIFLSFPSRHFCFEQPKCASSRDGGAKKKKNVGLENTSSSGKTRQYAHTNCTYAELKSRRNLYDAEFQNGLWPSPASVRKQRPLRSAVLGAAVFLAVLQHLLYIGHG